MVAAPVYFHMAGVVKSLFSGDIIVIHVKQYQGDVFQVKKLLFHSPFVSSVDGARFPLKELYS